MELKYIKKMSSENTLWMGNIKQWMTEEIIKKYFLEYGFNPKDIKLIKNKNFCCIVFDTFEEANNALNQLKGKTLPNTDANFYLKSAKPKSNLNLIEIYIYNLNKEINESELYDFFIERYESLHHVSIIKDKLNKESKGYGFLYFLDKEDSEKCIKEMNNFIFCDKPLKLKLNSIDKTHKKNSDEITKNENKNRTRIF